MKYEIPLRVTVDRPPAGVTMQVQRGKDELLPPAVSSGDSITFEFPVNVDTSSGTPNFLGKFAQGSRDARFIYVNSGTSAGQHDSCWTRRAKISLMGITREQVEQVLRVGLATNVAPQEVRDPCL